MRYAMARYKQYQHDQAYRIYITDSLQMVGQNKYFTKRWWDMIHPPKIDIRPAEEIAADVINKAGLRFD